MKKITREEVYENLILDKPLEFVCFNGNKKEYNNHKAIDLLKKIKESKRLEVEQYRFGVYEKEIKDFIFKPEIYYGDDEVGYKYSSKYALKNLNTPSKKWVKIFKSRKRCKVSDEEEK